MNEQLGNRGMIGFLRMHLPDHEHRDDEWQQACDGHSKVLNHRRDDRISVTLRCNIATILFQLVMAGLDDGLLFVELRSHLRLCRDQFTPGFRVAFDQFLRGFRDLVA